MGCNQNNKDIFIATGYFAFLSCLFNIFIFKEVIGVRDMLIEICLKHINKIKGKLFGKYVYRRNEYLFTKHTPSYARNSVIHFPFCIKKEAKIQ